MEKSRVKPSIHLALILGITGSCFAMASSPVAQLQDPESTQYFNHAPCLVPNKGEGGRERTLWEDVQKSWSLFRKLPVMALCNNSPKSSHWFAKRLCCFCSELKPFCPCYSTAQLLQQVMCTLQLTAHAKFQQLVWSFLHSEAFWNSLFLKEIAGSCSAWTVQCSEKIEFKLMLHLDVDPGLIFVQG